MIIGSGFIAKNFENYNDDLERLNICLYAAGISNSQTQDKNLLDKEKNKFIEFLKKFNQKKKLIYISTCSINDPSRNKNPYVVNKLYIEDLVQKNITFKYEFIYSYVCYLKKFSSITGFWLSMYL